MNFETFIQSVASSATGSVASSPATVGEQATVDMLHAVVLDLCALYGCRLPNNLLGATAVTPTGFLASVVPTIIEYYSVHMDRDPDPALMRRIAWLAVNSTSKGLATLAGSIAYRLGEIAEGSFPAMLSGVKVDINDHLDRMVAEVVREIDRLLEIVVP